MGGGSGGGGNSTTVQKADPWAGVQPYLTQGYQQLSNLYQPGQGPVYFPGQTVASPNGMEAFGQGMQIDQAHDMQNLADVGSSGLQQLGSQAGQAAQTGKEVAAMGTGGQNWLAAALGNPANQANGAMSQLAGYGGSGLTTLGNNAMGDAINQLRNAGGMAVEGRTGQGSAISALGGYGGITGAGLGGAANAMNQLAGQGGMVGQGQAGINNAMSQLGQFGSAAGQGQGNMNAAAGQYGNASALTGQGSAGINSAMSQLNQAGDPAHNPFFQQAVQAAIRPVTQQFTEQTLPGIASSAIGAGQMGGSRQGIAQGIAARGYQDTVGDITANMGNAAYAQGLQALQASGQLGTSAANLGLNATQGLAGLGQSQAGLGLNAAQNIGQLGSNVAGLGQQGLQSAGQLGQNLGNLGISATQGAGQLAQGMTGQGLQASQASGQQGQALNQMALGATQNAGSLGAQMAALQGNLYGNLGSQGISQQQNGMTGLGQASALAPGAISAQQMPGQMIQSIGQQRTADQQAQIDAQVARYNFGQNLPYTMIQDYLQALNGAQGGMTTSQQTGGGRSSPLMGALGGAGTGAAIGSAFAPGIGTAIGAGAGALLSLF